jgi:hypothetical protein
MLGVAVHRRMVVLIIPCRCCLQVRDAATSVPADYAPPQVYTTSLQVSSE